MNTKPPKNTFVARTFLTSACCLLLATAPYALAAPKGKPSPTPNPSPSPVATPAPSPTPALTPQPSPTPPATASPTPTIAPSPTATVAPARICPLPATYGLQQANAHSPEKPPKDNQPICHNGMILCLPPSAYAAHRQHGDPVATYDCTGKTGNTGATCTDPTAPGHSK